MMSPLRALLVVSPLLLAACTAQVIGGGTSVGGGGGGGTGGSGDGSGGTIITGPAQPNSAVAMSRAQTDLAWDNYWQTHGGEPGSSSSGGGADLDPNDLFLRFSDLGAACGEPTTDLGCGGHWQVTMVLPTAFQQVGVYDLEDPALIQYSSVSETGQPNSPAPNDCSWGGGSVGGGTLEILAIDAAQVHFRFTLTSSTWEFVPGGEYTAPRCP